MRHNVLFQLIRVKSRYNALVKVFNAFLFVYFNSRITYSKFYHCEFMI